MFPDRLLSANRSSLMIRHWMHKRSKQLRLFFQDSSKMAGSTLAKPAFRDVEAPGPVACGQEPPDYDWPAGTKTRGLGMGYGV